jgi:hypothetical protein
MMKVSRLLLLAAPALLAACAGGLQEPIPPEGPVQVRTLNNRQTGSLTVLRSCPRADRADGGAEQVAGPAAALALAAVPVLVDLGVSAISDYLARLEAERTGAWDGRGAIALPTDGAARSGCIVVARGRIGTAGSGRLARQGTLGPNDMEAVGLTHPPDFYMEIAFTLTPRPPVRGAAAGTSAGADILLRPQIVHYARTVARRGTDDPKAVGMVLVMRTTPLPDGATRQTAGTGADAVFAFNLGTLRPGQEIRPVTFPAPAEPGPAHPLADLVQGGTLAHGRGTLNLGVFVTETGEPERVLVLLNDVLERQRKGLTDALTTAVQDAVKAALTPRPAGGGSAAR